MIGLMGVTTMEAIGLTFPHVFKDIAKDPRINIVRMNLKIFIRYPKSHNLNNFSDYLGKTLF